MHHLMLFSRKIVSSWVRDKGSERESSVLLLLKAKTTSSMLSDCWCSDVLLLKLHMGLGVFAKTFTIYVWSVKFLYILGRYINSFSLLPSLYGSAKLAKFCGMHNNAFMESEFKKKLDSQNVLCEFYEETRDYH